MTGTSMNERSHCELALGQIHHQEAADAPPITLYFDTDRTVLDISAAFEGVPADVLQGAGIPAAVLAGPVSVDRRGDAGDGAAALLTQMCQGKFVLDPAAMLALIGSDKVTAFAQSSSEDYLPLRAFNAHISIFDFLDAMGLTPTALINQIAVLGYDMRSEVGESAVTAFDDYLRSSPVELAWFIDEQDRVHTAQAVLMLTEFFGQLLRSDAVLELMALEENCTPDEMLDFVEETAAKGRLVYVCAMWQAFEYDSEITAVDWPEAPDISGEVAAQAARLRDQAATVRPSEPGAAVLPGNVTIDARMLEQMQSSSGAIQFVVTEVDGNAEKAMAAAQTAVGAVRHPDEPSEPLASFLSEVVAIDGGAQFWADISDMEEHRDILEGVLITAAAAIGEVVTSAHLSGAPTSS